MGFAKFIRAYRKRKVIGLYLIRLGPTLARLYGKADHYPPEQVKRAAQQAKLPMTDLCYGLSLYCTPEDFADYHSAHGEECSYWAMRVEVAECHFQGNTGFTQQDVVAHSVAHTPSHAGMDFGGGHHHGDSGGHHGGHF